MITRFKLNTGALRAFDTTYDITLSDIASQTRGDFLKAFPKEHLNRLSLEKYVIGHQTPTFCAYVEAKTRAWANIQGATAIKFGIYFGRTKSDPKKLYRYNTRKYSDMNEAFRAVKA